MSIATLPMARSTPQGPAADSNGPSPEPRPSLIPLTRLRVGQSAVIDASGLDDAAGPESGAGGGGDGTGGAAMLRAMGLTPDAKIRLCRLGEPCIVAVRCACGGQTRIGLARRVASRIMVQVVG